MKKAKFFLISFTVLVILILTLFFLIFLKVMKHVDEKSLTIVGFGDSITEGYGMPYEYSYTAQLEKLLRTQGFPNTVIYNKGTSGYTSYDGLQKVDEVLALHPDIVIVEFGANDARRRLPAPFMKENVSLIVEKLREHGVVVVLAGMRTPFAFAGEYGYELEKAYEEIAKKEKVIFVENILEGVTFNSNLVLSDSMHPNKEGYTIIARQILYPKVLQAIQIVKDQKISS